jgi:Uma2 family endonuclease
MATRYRFGVEEFERLFQGVKHLELLEGEIYEMSPIGPRRVFAVAQLDKRLQALLGEEAVIAVQSPLRLSPDSEPEPDLQVLKPPLEQYSERLPEPQDVLLLIEVADTSLDHDRRKLALYAKAGIPEVWIVNLVENLLEVYRHPQEDHYRLREILFPGEAKAPLAFPHRPIPWS